MPKMLRGGHAKFQKELRAAPGAATGNLNNRLSDGAPEEIRTPDPQIRSLVLYPAELRARRGVAIALRG